MAETHPRCTLKGKHQREQGSDKSLELLGGGDPDRTGDPRLMSLMGKTSYLPFPQECWGSSGQERAKVGPPVRFSATQAQPHG
jgi:hypothetical protein